MLIKICGITNKEDAMNAVALNVNAIGYIFYENSPRYVQPERIEAFMRDIPPFVSTVGVFVNASYDYIMNVVERCNLTTIQLHGDEPPDFCCQFNYSVIKAIPVETKQDLEMIPQYKGVTNAILLDTKAEHVRGGTGRTFDWGLANEAKEYDTPLILSGGINADNISNAIKIVSPYAIDLSSGVEKEPGIKDYNKMKELLSLIR